MHGAAATTRCRSTMRRGPMRRRCSRPSSAMRSPGRNMGEHQGATMPATAMNHFTILTDDVDATIAFYGEFLGIAPGARPPFDFPGAWLYANGQPILHVIGGRPKEELKAGVIDHMAFSAQGLA